MPIRGSRCVLAMVVVAALLVGCGGDEEEDEATAPTTTAPETTTPEEPEPTTTSPRPPDAPTGPPSTAPAAPSPVPSQSPPPNDPVPLTTTVLASNLEVPWSVVFLPDGTALVSERKSGRILSVDRQGGTEEVARLPSSDRGEGGLLGLAVSPTYDRDGYVYAYFTTDQDNRLVRFRLGEPPEPLLTGISAASIHNGGRLAFGPDGMLYVTTGDAGSQQAAQDPTSLNGKILRIRPDGSVPDDNPMAGNPVYSLGHRNVQGLDWTADGTLYATEFGQNTFDEVNRIQPGGNYGWPEVEGTGGSPRFVDPITVWSTDEASPSGAVIPKESAIPQWDGDFLLAALAGERVWRLDLGPDGALLGRESLYQGEFGRLRHLAQAPDGSLWLLTSNRDGRGDPVPGDDRIIRIGP